MEILEQTRDRITLASASSVKKIIRSYLWAGGIIAVLTAGISYFTFSRWAAAGALTTLICDRVEPKQVDCQLIQKRVDGSSSTQAITRLSGATLTQTEHEDDEGDTYYKCKVALTNPEGNHEIPLQQFDYSSPAGCQAGEALVSQIKTFVADPNLKVSTYQEDSRVSPKLPLIMTLSFLGFEGLCLGLAILGLRVRRLTLCRQLQQGVFQWEGVFGKRSQEFSLNQVRHLLVEDSIDSDNDHWREVQLILKTGEKLPVMPNGYQSDHLKKCDRVVAAITQVVDLPIHRVNK